MEKTCTIPTAEPFFIPGGNAGCLLVHGFTGTPKEMRMLASSIAQDGYTVLAPRLFRHATSPQDMNRARWTDWLASVEDCMNLLKGCTNRQYIMGLSMGGVLALLAAARYPFAGVVTFSAPCDLPPDPRRKLLPLLSWLNPKTGKGVPDWRNPDAAKDHVDYPYYQVRPVLELQRLINAMRAELEGVRIPALLVQSKLDKGIPIDSLDFLYEQISSEDKTRLWVENSGHVVIREPDREEIFLAIKTFLKKIEDAQ